MSETPRDLTDPPDVQDRARAVQAVRDGLACLRFSGSVFLRAHLSTPWAYESPSAAEIAGMLGAKDERIILFHVITEGSCRIELAGSAGVDLYAGDVVIMPFSDQHRMGNPDTSQAVPLAQILPDPAKTPVLTYGGSGPVMSMVCGYLRSDDVPFNPVLQSLPPLLRVPTAGGPLGRWVDASIQYAMHVLSNQRIGDDPLLQRLPELMVVECLCDYATKQRQPEGGWLAGLADPIVGRALGSMHRAPERRWTLKDLAKTAGTSRSVLDERFRQFLGTAPMGYLTSWRLQLASRKLQGSADTLMEVAEAVGYGSEASFSRAFKRHVGVSPGEWRSRDSVLSRSTAEAASPSA